MKNRATRAIKAAKATVPAKAQNSPKKVTLTAKATAMASPKAAKGSQMGTKAASADKPDPKKSSKLAYLKDALLSAAGRKGKAKAAAVPPAKKGASAPKGGAHAQPAKAAAKAGANHVAKASAPAAKAGHKEVPKDAQKEALKLAKAKNASAPKGKAAGKGKAQSYYTRGAGGSEESVCREVACEGLSTSGGYCRLHYIKNWKKIKRKELILREKKLNQYIEELVVKYPDKYIEAIRQDLANDKDFAKVIYDLDLDESLDDFEVEGESADSLIDTIKRDFEDEGEGF